MKAAASGGVRIASVSLPALAGDADARAATLAGALRRAAREGVELAVFPPACLTGGVDPAAFGTGALAALAQPVDGPALAALARAVDATGVAAGVGLIEQGRDGRLYDSYALCAPGGYWHWHRQLHARDPRFARGDSVSVQSSPWGMRIGILLDADVFVADTMRVAALAGADLLIAPHRLSTRDSHAWARCVLPARALDNGVYVVANGVGVSSAVEPLACVIDPAGCLVASDAEAVLADARIAARSAGRAWFGVRRPELYGRLAAAHADTPPRRRASVAGGSIALGVAIVPRRRDVE
ncbi:nitrilase [Burkholderia sp. FERM BP-3421]|jgi:predicted amidohydrolase|uniref:nitrilase-related carbon-nitrogen hydrolase n=1 Tax=Burkholderia sp. FERM BP-3421 TaxID=1494466 RepID=UPI0023619269|nr:nitrilase-related carbon-nitrogen hydrolase [Burkholderia sp. FERM BP-3421]WDD90782.1 nitrilase [Burkholderia sp. FERM BP-3421]